MLKRLWLAFRFLSIFPLGRGGLKGVADELGRSTAFFPLVGLAFGLILYIMDRLLILILPIQVVSVFLVLLWIALSGGLHLDGLADTADGLFGSRERNESLTIMRDSRIGVFGVIAIVSLLFLKVSLLSFLSGDVRREALLLAPALGRWTVPFTAVLFPTAKDKGLGKAFSDSVGIFELALASVSAVLVTALFLKFKSPFVLFGVVFLAVIFGLLITRRIGGMTGDTFGALIELTEILVLLMALIVL